MSEVALQVNSAADTEQAPYFSKLQCPACLKHSLALNDSGAALSCPACTRQYPLINAGKSVIPFLFAHVDAAVQGWAARLNGFQLKHAHAIESLRIALKDKKMSTLTRRRIKLLLKAKEHYVEQICTPLEFFREQSFSSMPNANVQLAQNQGVDSYINNIFRDWCWENGENEQLLEAVAEVAPLNSFDPGEVLTIGAGASRLSCDFHRKWKASYSVLLDINPFLLATARKIIDGNSVSLYEFPVAPGSIEHYAVLQQCKIPDSIANIAADSFDCVLADAGNVPFSDKSFDTVLTPWLVDIIPMDMRDFIPHVNRLLKTGGLWLNTGSLAFFHKNESWNYSEEELKDLLQKYGFQVEQVQRKEFQYLHSPLSAHGRVEKVFSFCARKKFDSVTATPYVYLPEWITNDHTPVPDLQELAALSSKHLLQAQVLSAIDGARSIRDIGDLLANQYGMSEEKACAAVRQILVDNYKDYLA